jgi:hypothetical protein
MGQWVWLRVLRQQTLKTIKIQATKYFKHHNTTGLKTKAFSPKIIIIVIIIIKQTNKSQNLHLKKKA